MPADTSFMMEDEGMEVDWNGNHTLPIRNCCTNNYRAVLCNAFPNFLQFFKTLQNAIAMTLKQQLKILLSTSTT
jgi:hypothetical protein